MKSSDSAKALAKKKAAKRTDAAGRSGMGESASSNIKSKGGSSDFSSANKTGIAAFKKTLKSTGDSGKAADAMYGSIENAYKYADSRRKK